MGKKKTQKERFIADNPRCCFCGGEAPTEEYDEQPPRAFFVEHRWPQEYRFPACATCNRRSSSDDQVFAFVGRWFNPDGRHARDDDLRKLLDGIRNNQPTLLPVVELSANEKRRAARKIGLRLAPGETYGDLPLAAINPKVGPRIEASLRKLTCALYYKDMNKKILSKEAALISAAEYNVSVTDSNLVRELLPRLGELVTTSWNSVEITDQFSYRWAFEPKLQLFIFLGWFANAFVGMGAAVESRDQLAQEELTHPWFDVWGNQIEIAASA